MESLIMEKQFKKILDIIIYLFIALFVYTAVSKLGTFETFERTLGRSPLIGGHSSILAFVIPVTEIMVSVSLMVPATKNKGLYASLALMVLFTGYLIYMVSSGRHLPCSCGGVISLFTWKQHIWFNSVFVLLALLGIGIHHRLKILRA